MKIKSLQLVNFQAHKKRTLRLSRHVTCIIGSSDVGKSSIVRALKWLVFSRPSGSGIVRHGEKNCSVKVKLGDGTVIAHRRGRGPVYQVDDKKFLVVGTKVPEDISDKLRLSQLNIQNQHDAPFWLSLSPGQVSKELNSIVDLDVIDTALSRVNQKARQATAELSVSQQRLSEARQDVRELRWVPDAVARVQELSRCYKDVQRLEHSCVALSQIVENVEYVAKRIAMRQNASQAGLTMRHALQDLRSHQSRALRLQKAAGQLKCVEDEIRERRKEQRQVEKRLARVRRCPLCQQPLANTDQGDHRMDGVLTRPVSEE